MSLKSYQGQLRSNQRSLIKCNLRKNFRKWPQVKWGKIISSWMIPGYFKCKSPLESPWCHFFQIWALFGRHLGFMKVFSFQPIYRMSHVIAHFWLFFGWNCAFLMLFWRFDQYIPKYGPPWSQMPKFEITLCSNIDTMQIIYQFRPFNNVK